jgi:hypothetical protein
MTAVKGLIDPFVLVNVDPPAPTVTVNVPEGIIVEVL